MRSFWLYKVPFGFILLPNPLILSIYNVSKNILLDYSNIFYYFCKEMGFINENN